MEKEQKEEKGGKEEKMGAGEKKKGKEWTGGGESVRDAYMFPVASRGPCSTGTSDVELGPAFRGYVLCLA